MKKRTILFFLEMKTEGEAAFPILRFVWLLVFLGGLQVNSVEAQLPSATTLTPKNVTYYSVDMGFDVNPNGLNTTVYFQWQYRDGQDVIHTSTSSSVNIGSGTSDVFYYYTSIGPLLPNTSYTCQCMALNINGTVSGGEASFTTLPAPAAPSATTSPASLVTNASATLNGSVNPNSLSTTAYFEYGTNSSYGSSTPPVDLGAGASLQNINCKITNLIGGTIYYYRVAANNTYGTNYGANTTFTTANTDPFSALELNLVNVRLLKTNGLIFDIQLPANLNGYIVNGHIEVSTNLTSWTTLTNFVGSNSIATVSDPVATNAIRRFYRAAIP
jgi:hypothetical protein